MPAPGKDQGHNAEIWICLLALHQDADLVAHARVAGLDRAAVDPWLEQADPIVVDRAAQGRHGRGVADGDGFGGLRAVTDEHRRQATLHRLDRISDGTARRHTRKM